MISVLAQNYGGRVLTFMQKSFAFSRHVGAYHSKFVKGFGYVFTALDVIFKVAIILSV